MCFIISISKNFMRVMGIGNSGIGKKWEWEWFCGNAREWEQKQSFPHTAIG